ncbi:beta-citrylglutamate synthase B [Sapajus apella]|uniref:Beta-citrylglutamate synthase B n=1 Tax=Sapajus apella TaxID=9515 RepID=A0A6J3H6U1_SAPAP|nr:beta-citrylglutamate synthase B [Sapajus apella]
MCSSVAAKLWFLTDRRIREDYPQKEILRALKAKCCEEELDFRAVVMDEVVLTIEQGNLGKSILSDLLDFYLEYDEFACFPVLFLLPGGVGMMCSLSEQGKQLAIQVSNILGMDVCGIDLLMKDDGSFCVCEANANVGFIAFDKACNLDVAGIIADYATSLLPSGRLTRRMSLLSVVSTASETSEPELGPPASTAVDNMSASSSSVDSDPESTERELLTKLPGGLFNMNQLLANEIKLLVD